MLQGTSLPNLQDIIVAQASAPGAAARAVVRLSGTGSLALANQIWRSEIEEKAELSTRWTAGRILPWGWLETESIPGSARMWRNGTGYTGQEAVEFHFLGAVPCVEAILQTLNRLGARGAGPGEFTLRAFLAGKVDLVRAEALLGMTNAATPAQLADALDQHAGGISEPLARLRGELLDFLADIEASLDFADEDIAQLPTEASLSRITSLLAQANFLARKMQGRAHLAAPFRVALVGLPNAGKSTLFNLLTGASPDQGALVSPVPGTTRDWLARQTTLPGGRKVEWVDTAGWQPVTNTIEEQAQALGKAAADRADLVLVCRHVESPFGEIHRRFGEGLSDRSLQVVTCVDLRPEKWTTDHCDLPVSGLTGQGVDQLLARVAEEASQRGNQAVAPHLARGKEHVEKLVVHLRAAHQLVLEEDPAELVALEIRSASDELGTILGTVFSDDLLGRVFSRFCIGK